MIRATILHIREQRDTNARIGIRLEFDYKYMIIII